MADNDFFIDLHIHTNCSDGTFTPSEVVEYAAKVKLAAISITDHDCVSGIDEAIEAASGSNLEIIPGIELSVMTGDGSNQSEMHILGYFIDYKSKEFNDVLNVFKKARLERAYKIFEKLKQSGAELKDLSFMENIGNKAIGRLHFAKALIEENYVNSIQEAFQVYLAPNRPAFVSKYVMTASEAIRLIKSVGGIPVMAHPYYTHYNDKNLMKMLVDEGLMGIEAWHIKHNPQTTKKILNIAQEFDLIATGGSDCHGPYKDEPPIMGTVKIPYSVLENLENAKGF